MKHSVTHACHPDFISEPAPDLIGGSTKTLLRTISLELVILVLEFV